MHHQDVFVPGCTILRAWPSEELTYSEPHKGDLLRSSTFIAEKEEIKEHSKQTLKKGL